MPHLLMITFHYPPSNTSSGGLRPLKLGKYLRDFGWESSVLTVPEACYESTDAASLQQIPAGVRVHRAACFDSKARLAVRGKYPAFLAVPDRFVSWLPFATRMARRAVREEGVAAVYSTSPIPTAHLIGLAVKRKTGLPWVADFRDPWVETEGSEVHKPLRQAVELWLERRVVNAADAVVVTTPELGEYLGKRYGERVRSKLRVVYNGYDEDDFAGLSPITGNPGVFTLVHAGLLDRHYRNPVPILQAVRRCLDDGRLPATVELQFIGSGGLAQDVLPQAVAELRLEAVVKIIDRLPYRQALARLAGASALLLMQGGDDTWMLIPAKAFEYLRLGRPLLATAPATSATARLVRPFEGAVIAEPDDPDAIARALVELYAVWSNGHGSLDRRPALEPLSRRAAAQRMAEVLDEVVLQVRGLKAPG